MQKLKYFPIMFFAVIMGLGGFGLALRAMSEILALRSEILLICIIFTSVIFAVITLFYLAKIIFHFEAVKLEFSHPIKLNFFAAFSISLLILALLYKDFVIIHNTLFYSGLIVQTFLTFYVISFWINHNLELKHSNPAWFIPIVGNLIVPLSANEMSDFLWFYFCVGMFFWVILFAIIFYRILFHDQLPSKFMPTLFIMIAPPAVGFLDFIKLSGGVDFIAIFLLNLALFFTLLVAFMFKNFLKLEFALSWWAFTFPSAAMCVASFKAFSLLKSDFWLYFGFICFAFLSVIILFISYHTIKNILENKICVAE